MLEMSSQWIGEPDYPGLLKYIETAPPLICVKGQLTAAQHPCLSIVGARKLVGDTPITKPSDLLVYPWLQETGSNEVSNWLRENGVTSGRVQRMTHLPGADNADGKHIRRWIFHGRGLLEQVPGGPS